MKSSTFNHQCAVYYCAANAACDRAILDDQRRAGCFGAPELDPHSRYRAALIGDALVECMVVRDGTPAQKKDNVLLADKKARLSALQSLLKEQQKKFNKSFVGSTMEILFEKKGRYQDQYIGRSIYNQSVFTKNNKNLINTIKNVKILNSTDFALESSI